MDYKKIKEDATKAYESLMASTLEKCTDEDIKQLGILEKRISEADAALAMENRSMPAPKAKEENLTESQKWCNRFTEAVTTRSTFSGAMPMEMATDVVEKIGQYAALISKCRVRVLTSDLSVAVESGLPTVDYVAEGAAIGASDPTLASVVLSPKMLACISKISTVFAADASFDIVSYVEGAIARAIANKLDHEILFGTGTTSTIEGITVKTGINKVTTAAVGVMTWAECKKALSSLKGYKAGCTVVVSQEVADMIHEYKDTNGNYIFKQDEELTHIQGHQVVICDQMPTVASGAVMMVAGNLYYYEVGQRQTVDMQVLNELYAPNNQVGIKTTVRFDGKVGQAEAFVAVVSKAT